jgi:SAM-dependent methyltransferase
MKKVRSEKRRKEVSSVAKTNAFDAQHQRYEAWFEKHAAAYLSELLALRPFVPWQGLGIEIGVGSGRFAAPLGVQVGVDPSRPMLAHAAVRGVRVVAGTAENLPFAEEAFDFALVVTTICFVDSPAEMLAETRRVLKPGGRLVIGFIDRDSPLGQDYLLHQADSVFYRNATFYSAEEVADLLIKTGFSINSWGQTLSHPLPETRDIEPLQAGRGRHSFLVVAATNQALPEETPHRPTPPGRAGV